jgi:putative salt-induced outer membrane protein YdiY
MFRTQAALLAAALLALSCAVARAQPLTPTINPSASPITVYQQPEKVAVRPKVEDQRLVNLAFGATANAGNTQSYAGNVGGRIGLIHNIHQLTLEALGTLGGGRPRDENGEKGRLRWTSRNVISRIRYDLFLSTMDALFVAIAPRRDRFAGIDLRLQNQIGYLRNLYFPVDAHRLWSELGYDFTFDEFGTPEGAAKDVAPVEDDARAKPFVHSARVFLGYTNRLSPTAQLSLGLETLLDFESARNVRVNGLVELTSSITHSFKLGLQARVLYDHEVPRRTYKADLIAAVQVVYTFDSLAGALNAPCPVCDCTPQVQAARASCRADPLRQITP